MDLTVVGSINTDLICYSSRFPLPGETIEGTKFSVGFGGKGANQCVAARKLGAAVSLVSRVGDDAFGRNYLEYLKRIGVETGTIPVSTTAASGVAIITVEQTFGNNQIIIVPGANNEISIEDVDEAIKKELVSKKVMVCQFEACVTFPICVACSHVAIVTNFIVILVLCPIIFKANATATLHAMEWAKAHDVLTILDPAPAPNPHSDFAPLLPRFLAASSIVCPNETEAAALTGIPRWEVQPDQIPEASIPWLLALWKRSVKYPLVTLGLSGVIALLPRSESDLITAMDVRVLHCDQLPDDKAIFHLRAPVHAKALDTTGAGDCFTGALAFYISKYPGLKMVEKIRRSVWIASQSVLRMGTQASFYSRDELHPSLFDDKKEFTWP
ncbi:unnamed protein product [Dibothriocephalus latus]|uniref:Ribokinase n=1 Tax=Dibothriocephalus latus TaxID=60516 RepID=A0A3P7KXN6_DIBLA|nr:unnamed protein product [Dibothriocephalus latus]